METWFVTEYAFYIYYFYGVNAEKEQWKLVKVLILEVFRVSMELYVKWWLLILRFASQIALKPFVDCRRDIFPRRVQFSITGVSLWIFVLFASVSVNATLSASAEWFLRSLLWLFESNLRSVKYVLWTSLEQLSQTFERAAGSDIRRLFEANSWSPSLCIRITSTSFQVKGYFNFDDLKEQLIISVGECRMILSESLRNRKPILSAPGALWDSVSKIFLRTSLGVTFLS